MIVALSMSGTSTATSSQGPELNLHWWVSPLGFLSKTVTWAHVSLKQFQKVDSKWFLLTPSLTLFASQSRVCLRCTVVWTSLEAITRPCLHLTIKVVKESALMIHTVSSSRFSTGALNQQITGKQEWSEGCEPIWYCQTSRFKLSNDTQNPTN